MTLGHARETVPASSLEGETGHGPQARKGMSVVLIDQHDPDPALLQSIVSGRIARSPGRCSGQSRGPARCFPFA